MNKFLLNSHLFAAICLCHVFFSCASCFAYELSSCHQILYLAQNGNIKDAIDAYRSKYESCQQHDFDLLQELGFIILEQGFRSTDAEIVLMSLFGAGISTNEKIIPFLAHAASNDIPQIQLLALNFLARYQNDEADFALKKGMSSNYPIIRLECSYLLAARDDENAVDHAEALMAKLGDEAQPLFAQLYAKIGSKQSLRLLRKMMTHKNPLVRISAILSAAENDCEQVLGQIQILAKQPEPLQKEACAWALGNLKDTKSIPLLKNIAAHDSKPAKLAALISLYKLGDEEARYDIEHQAKEGDLFAITLLGNIEGSENLLAQLAKEQNVHIRINASIALLKRHDSRCLPGICEVLIQDAKDLAITTSSSMGRSLTAYKIVPCASENFHDNPSSLEISRHIREELLIEASKLPLDYFLLLAKSLFEYEQNDLIPILVALVEEKKSSQAIALLNHYRKKAGAPLVRLFCQLALLRSEDEKNAEEALENWISKEIKEEMIHFRPIMPITADGYDKTAYRYQLNPEEKTKLLIETIETFALRQDDLGIRILLKAIAEGNPKNRYALAGLLIRSCQ